MNGLGIAHKYHAYSETESHDLVMEEDVTKAHFGHNIHAVVDLNSFATIPELLAAALTYQGLCIRPPVIPNVHIVNAIPKEWEPFLKHIPNVTSANIEALGTSIKFNPSILNGTFRNYYMMFYIDLRALGSQEARENVHHFLTTTLHQLGWKQLSPMTFRGTILYSQKTSPMEQGGVFGGKLLIPPQKDIYSTAALDQLPSYDWNQDEHERPWKDIKKAMNGNNINFLTDNIKPSNMTAYIKGDIPLASGPLDRNIVKDIAKAVCGWTNEGNSPDNLAFKDRLWITVIQTHAFLNSEESMDVANDGEHNADASNEGTGEAGGGSRNDISTDDRGSKNEQQKDPKGAGNRSDNGDEDEAQQVEDVPAVEEGAANEKQATVQSDEEESSVAKDDQELGDAPVQSGAEESSVDKNDDGEESDGSDADDAVETGAKKRVRARKNTQQRKRDFLQDICDDSRHMYREPANKRQKRGNPDKSQLTPSRTSDRIKNKNATKGEGTKTA